MPATALESAPAAPASRASPWTWSMTTKLAWRNLAHDRVRLVVTLVGIVFSVVLMGMQSGLLVGFTRTTTGLVDNARADLWMVPKGTLDVDLGGPLDERRRYQALAVAGVAKAEPYLVNFARWKKPDGGTESIQLVGHQLGDVLGGPWNLEVGSIDDLRRPDGVIVDRLYAGKLGVSAVGDTVEINGRRARVVGFTRGIRTFTQSPYVFTSLPNAREFVGLPGTTVGYVLLALAPGADAAAVESEIEARIPEVEVYQSAAFAESSSSYWLFTTGAGFSLIISALLGLVVGIVIVAQTLYASTIDRLPEYATLKAMGAPNSYLYRIIVAQAGIGAVIGYAAGIVIVIGLVFASREASAAPVLPVSLALGLGALTLVMCIGAAVLSIRKVMAIDPVGVFR
ncbi:MAG: ABC transporter permease [Nannocystaceae bacterium]|jgi:putative ABC transport system permease protein|nr:ABC transporter permease [Nannocystaceae bacterium]